MSWFSLFFASRADEESCEDSLDILDCPEIAEEVLNSLRDRVEELEEELSITICQRDSAEMLVAELEDKLEAERLRAEVLTTGLEKTLNDSRNVSVSLLNMETEDIAVDEELPPFPEMTKLEYINPQDFTDAAENLPKIKEEDNPWD